MARLKKPPVFAVAFATVLVTLLITVPTSTANAAETYQFQVAFTDNGVYPRASASLAAEKVGQALADGSTVTVTCETEGEQVANGYTSPSNIWAKLEDGSFLPTAYFYSGVDGRSPGVPDCSAEQAPATPADSQGKGHQDWRNRLKTQSPLTYPWQMRIEYDPQNAGPLEVTDKLATHYYRRTDFPGADVVIDWEFFKHSEGLRSEFYKKEIGGKGEYEATKDKDGLDMELSVHKIDFYRIDESCIAIYDYYNFELLSPYFAQALDAQVAGTAKPFNVLAFGCYNEYATRE